MTSVDEWTNADTGVGAAIAAGSHLEKGTWALFVSKPPKIKKKIKGGSFSKRKYRWP